MLPSVQFVYRYPSKLDLFSKDVVLIPINHANSHWTAAAINFRRKRIESYDSMGAPRPAVYKVPLLSLYRGGSTHLPKGVAQVLG